MSGTLDSAYITFKYLKVPSVLIQNNEQKGLYRNYCYGTKYEYQPF